MNRRFLPLAGILIVSVFVLAGCSSPQLRETDSVFIESIQRINESL